MKKIIFLFISVLALSACHESLEDRAEREAKEFTMKNCPMPVNEYITVDSMVYEKTARTIHYYYTIKGQADTTGISNDAAREGLLKSLKDNTSIKKFKEEGFNFAYTYFSAKNKGKKLIDFTFYPKDYNEK
ncbi:MAG: hypothetical protein Q4D41_07015 [Prevotellaceae bacterium]|nr:hypothetical protein [Prevotellaceae bacterium]